MNCLYFGKARLVCYVNDNDAVIPELWVASSLAFLESNMVMGALVYRDYENVVADFGDVVNAHRPARYRFTRKTDRDDVDTQDAVSIAVPVHLNQHGIVSFTIKDGERSKSMVDLLNYHVRPAMEAIARGIDRGLLGLVHKYFRTPTERAGRLGALSNSNARDYALDAREILNNSNVYTSDRRLVLSTNSETQFLKTDLFIRADQRGDGGTALERARLGTILGFDTFMDQNTPYDNGTARDIKQGTITNAAAAGSSGSQSCSISSYVVTKGEFAVVAGNDQPTWVVAETDNGTNTSAITLNEANKYATGASAVVTVYKKCAVDGNYEKGYTKEILVDGWDNAPQAGQMIAFGDTASTRHTYTIIESHLSDVGTQAILLDRPLEFAVGNDAPAFPGPSGAYNFAFHKEALALVSRPLAAPPAGTGAASAVLEHNGIAMRFVAQYQAAKQGTVINLDLLYGYTPLDVEMGVAVLG